MYLRHVGLAAALAVGNEDREVAVADELVENELLANKLGNLRAGMQRCVSKRGNGVQYTRPRRVRHFVQIESVVPKQSAATMGQFLVPYPRISSHALNEKSGAASPV
jgi:hypothetical protein